MRKLVAVLSLVSISLTAFAKDKCVTNDLLTEKAKIDKLEGLNDVERQFLIQGAYSVKMTQILACVGLNQKMSKADSEYGISYLEDELKTRIHTLESRRTNIETILANPETSEIERDVYSRSYELIPQEIEREKATTASLIKYIKKATGKF